MAFARQHLGSIVLLTLATLPLIGLMIYAERAQTRSAADLAVADRCMEWSHENSGTQLKDCPELAARCNRYFRIRSEKDADEDIQRWQTRTAHR